MILFLWGLVAVMYAVVMLFFIFVGTVIHAVNGSDWMVMLGGHMLGWALPFILIMLPVTGAATGVAYWWTPKLYVPRKRRVYVYGVHGSD